MSKIIGIDLGTTKSVVSILEDGKPVILQNSAGQRITASYVALKKTKAKKGEPAQEDNTEWIVGSAAKNQVALNPVNTFYGVKRLIGRRYDEEEVGKMAKLASYKIVPSDNGDAWVEVNGKKMPPVEISAMVLRELKAAAEKHLGEPVTQAVITVPAYFNDAQRQATKQAGAIAGLEVLRIVNEPTAAALAYGMKKKEDGIVAVYDLGGGTFDVSILQIDVDEETGESTTRVLATKGDTFLGGENFDERLTEFIIGKVNEQLLEANEDTEKCIDLKSPASRAANAQQLQRIREQCEKVKISLSSEETANFDLPFLMAGDDGMPVNFEYTMTRKELEGLVQDLIDKTLPPFKLALTDAGEKLGLGRALKLDEINEVLMVGAQTRMPRVVETVKQFYGKAPRQDVPPDEIVAQGAAVQAAILEGTLEGVVLFDVTPLSFGIRLAGDVMKVLVPRGSTIPTEVTDEGYSTSENNQRDVCIKIYQGERAKASDNRFMGEFTLDGIPPAKAGEPNLSITLAIDENGVLNVSAKDVKTGRAQRVTIQANGGLSKEEVARMLKDAEANAEKDRKFKEQQTAGANADYELKQAKGDVDQEYFTTAPEELKTQFNETVAELTKARASNNIDVMLEKTKALSEIRSAIGKAFSDAAATAATPANDDAAAATPEETPAPAAKQAPKGPAA